MVECGCHKALSPTALIKQEIRRSYIYNIGIYVQSFVCSIVPCAPFLHSALQIGTCGGFQQPVLPAAWQYLNSWVHHPHCCTHIP